MMTLSELVGNEVDGVKEPGDSDEVVVKWFGAGVSDVGAMGESGGASCDDKGVMRGDIGDATRSDGGSRRLIITAAVGSEDRKGDLIDSSGWELDHFRRNPVFLWAHDRSLPPIGRANRVWIEGVALRADVEFAPTPFAEEVAELYAKGFMRGVSVGFIPLETELRRASNGRRGYWYKHQELLEISAVPVPMHARALARSSADDTYQNVAELPEMREGLRNLWRAVAGMGEL